MDTILHYQPIINGSLLLVLVVTFIMRNVKIDRVITSHKLISEKLDKILDSVGEGGKDDLTETSKHSPSSSG